MSVLIGVVDQAISPTDKVSWSVNKIGGTAVWMSSSSDDTTNPTCHGCGQDRTLVVQLYCPLANSAYHRCLYVLVCSSMGCPQHNSWKVYRGMQFDPSYSKPQEKKKVVQDFSDDLWTDDQNDWGDDDADDWGDGGGDDDDNDDDMCNHHTPTDDWGCSEDLQAGRGASSESRSSGKSLNTEHETDSSMEVVSSDSSLRVHAVVTDQDLSSELSRMAVCGEGGDENQTTTPTTVVPRKGAEGGETDSNVSHVKEETETVSVLEQEQEEGEELLDVSRDVSMRFDHLASSVLNTKYNKAPPSSKPVVNPSLRLKPFYLNVFEASSQQSQKATRDDIHVTALIREYERAEGKQLEDLMYERDYRAKGKDKKGGGGGGGGGEKYEKADIKHGDRVFHKFVKELQKFPEQCIRYERCGQPLLVQSLSPVESVLPPCLRCGASRVFELQLTPALIPSLQTHDDGQSPPSLDFGTVLVYTCSQSCPVADGNLAEEHLIRQFEHDHHLYR